MERKVGSTFTYKNAEDSLVVKLRVVKRDTTKGHCTGCFFWDYLYPCDNKTLGSCRSSKRADGNHVIFEKVK